MSKGARLFWAIPAIVALVSLTWLFAPEREPEYNGRSLSHWLTLCRYSGTTQSQRDEAASAVRHIGTNALPILMRRASENPSHSRQNIGEFLFQHRITRAVIPNRVRAWFARGPDQTRGNQARLGMIILGADAAPAIAELARLASGPPGLQSTTWAIIALGDIGPPALPTLLAFATNPAAQCRASAIAEFPKLGTNASHVLPTLIALLNDADPEVTYRAASAIGDLGVSPETSVPALTACLQRTDPTLRAIVAMSLRKFGRGAQSALPTLQDIAPKESDPYTKRALVLLIFDLQKPTETTSP